MQQEQERVTRERHAAAQGDVQHAVPGMSAGCAMLLVGRCTGLAEAASAVTSLVDGRLEGCDPNTVWGASSADVRRLLFASCDNNQTNEYYRTVDRSTNNDRDRDMWLNGACNRPSLGVKCWKLRCRSLKVLACSIGSDTG